MPTITFSERALGTVDPVYTFTGNTVYVTGVIVQDGAQPASPVVAANNQYLGPVFIYFDNPVTSASVNVGYFDNIGSTRIEFRNAQGVVVYSVNNFQFGVQNFSFESDLGISSIAAIDESFDGAGFSLDTVQFSVPLEAPEPPDVSLSANDVGKPDRDFGEIDAGNFVFNQVLGGTDTADIFTFKADAAGTITITSYLDSNPSETKVIELQVQAGNNTFRVTPGATYPDATDYTLRIELTLEDSTADAAIDEFIDDQIAKVLSGIFDFKSFQNELLSLITTKLGGADDAAKLLGKMGKVFGALGLGLDVLNRADNVAHSADWQEQLFVECVDALVGLAASGAAGAGCTFIGTPIFGVIGGYATNLVYTYLISDLVREEAAEWFNDRVQDLPDDGDFIAEPSGAIANLSKYIFDPEWYLAEYPDAFASVSSGEVPSAYLHFLHFGAALGYLPNEDANPIDPSDIVDHGALGLPGNGYPMAAFTLPAEDMQGDRLSEFERDFVDYVNGQRTDGTELDLDWALGVVANRVARDWVQGQIDGPAGSFDPAALNEWAVTLSNGKSFAQAFTDLDGLPTLNLTNTTLLAAFTSDTDAEDLFQTFMTERVGAQTLLGLGSNRIGVAEYGGMWVVLIDGSATRGAPEDETSAGTLHLNGSEDRDVLYAGASAAVLEGYAGADDLAGGPMDDSLYGGAGDDLLIGRGGHDVLMGGAGNDVLRAGGVSEGVPIARPDLTLPASFQNADWWQSQPLDGEFDLEARSDVTDSTTVLHATVHVTGDGGAEYFAFTVREAGTRAIFDIDNSSAGFNSALRVYDAERVQITSDNDGSSLDAGSTTLQDVYHEYTFAEAGTYYLAIRGFNQTGVANGASFTLHVSLDSAVFDPRPDSHAMTLDGGAGNDRLEGGPSPDTAIYGSARGSYTITHTTTGLTVSGPDGVDELVSVERLDFSDRNLAFDLDGNAGITAKLIGALIGAPAVSNKVLMGIGMRYLDEGMSPSDLAELAIAAVMPGASNLQLIGVLHQNVLGSAPSAAYAQELAGLINAGVFTQATLTLAASGLGPNLTNIGFTGLQQTGVEYL